MFWALVILSLFAVLVAAIPRWPHSRNWGYSPSLVLGFAVAVLSVLVLMGRIT